VTQVGLIVGPRQGAHAFLQGQPQLCYACLAAPIWT